MPGNAANIGVSRAAGSDDMRVDPYLSCNFVVEIEGLLVGGCASCSGLEVETEAFEYREGGVNDYIHRFAGASKHPRLVFKHGLSPVDGLWTWHQDVVSGVIQRRNGTIYLLDRQFQPVRWWNFNAALPLKWTGPGLEAAKGEIAFESVELVHRGLTRPRPAPANRDIAPELQINLRIDGGFF